MFGCGFLGDLGDPFKPIHTDGPLAFAKSLS